MENYVRVRWAVQPEIDFGFLNDRYAHNETKLISKKEWLDYVDKRSVFERAHAGIVNKLKAKDKTKILKIRTTHYRLPDFSVFCNSCGDKLKEDGAE